MAELRSAIFWVLCPKQSLHCYMIDRALKVWENSLEIQTLLYGALLSGALLSAVGLLQIES